MRAPTTWTAVIFQPGGEAASHTVRILSWYFTQRANQLAERPNPARIGCAFLSSETARPAYLRATAPISPSILPQSPLLFLPNPHHLRCHRHSAPDSPGLAHRLLQS